MLLGLLIAFYSAPADATVSLSLSANGDFTPGSVITLETRVTANGGEKDDVVFGAILYPGSQVDPGLQSQNLLPDGWIFTATLSCTTVRCIAFLQINPTIPLPPPNVSDFLIAVTPFTIQPDEVPGTVITFNWQSTPSFQRLDFFGITSHPGISITVVPEPTTAALLAASLLAVGMAARRRG